MRKKKLAGLVALGIMAGSSLYMMGDDAGVAFAAEGETAKETIRLNDSYVRPDYVEVEKLRDTKKIIVINKKDIEEKGYKTVSDVLKDQPSISVGSSGWGQVDIRGQGSDQATRNLQVLIDGAPMTTMVNHPLPNNYDYVPVEQIEKIEIIPGGGSVIYGSGAAGGIINITTNLRSMNKPKSSITGEWNTDGIRAGFNFGTKLNDKFSVQGGYSRLLRDLYFVDTYRNSKYYYGGFRYDADKDHSLTFRFSRLDEASKFLQNVNRISVEREGRYYKPADGKYLDGDRILNTYNLTYNQNFGSKLKYSGDFFYTNGNYKNTKYFDGNMETRSFGTRMRLDYAYGKNDSLLVGIDLFEQESNLNYRTTATGKLYDFKYEKTTEALYLLNKMKRNRFTFTQGVRREKLIWKFDKDGGTKAKPIGGTDSSNRWNTAAEMSVSYNYSDIGKVFLRYEKGYTSPDGIQIADEVYSAKNKKLYAATSAQEETYNLWELGLQDKWGASTVNITLFSSETKNELNRPYFKGTYGWEYKTYNMFNTTRRGIELSLQQRLGKLTLTEGYTYLRGNRAYTAEGSALTSSHKQNEYDFTNSGLKYVPTHKASFIADYKFDKKWNASLKFNFFGKYNNFTEDIDMEKDGSHMFSYGLLDVSVKYRQNANMEWYAGITNLLGRTYYEYIGDSMGTMIPGSSRTYFGGFRYSF